MIVTQTFHIGREIECGEEFLAALPDDPLIADAVNSVLDMLQDRMPYKEFFVLRVDTEAMKAEVVEVV